MALRLPCADPGEVTPSTGTADVVDLAARRDERAEALARAAAAPVLHVTPAFLAALNCREAEQPVRRRLHAV